VQPTRLLTVNDTVDKENKRAFDALVAPEHVFTARDWGEEPYLKFLQKNCMAVEELKLKVGAQVMMLRNVSQAWTPTPNGGLQEVPVQLCNGSRGIVEDFIQAQTHTQAHTNTKAHTKAHAQAHTQEHTHTGRRHAGAGAERAATGEVRGH
jgi:hypothetical protein